MEFWETRDKTVVLGDLNTRPGEPELELLGKAGLIDAFVVSDIGGDGFTSRSDARIDYIWISPDLKARDFSIGTSQASDHFPIAVTIDY